MSDPQTHTPEPWVIKGRMVAVRHSDGTWYGVANVADGGLPPVKRMVKCANACEGMEDPTKLREQRDALLKAAEKAQCSCSIAERESGHLVDCWMPELINAIAKPEGRAA